jgi:molybdenum cofactor biosynthesis enzyme MoaA
MTIRLMEDNQSAIRIILSGKNPTMKHLSRTQRLSINWLRERALNDEDFEPVYVDTKEQASDILTKVSTERVGWWRNMMLMSHFRASEFKVDPLAGGGGNIAVPGPLAGTKDGSHHIMSEVKGGRTVIEIACSNDSLLGKVAHDLKDCNHFRITQELDFTKKETVMYIADRARKKNVLLWISFPCTGGFPWYHLNSKRPGGQAKLKKHLSLFYRLWAKFGLLLDIEA